MDNEQHYSRRMKPTYSHAYQFLGWFGANADEYVNDRIEKTIQEVVAETHPETVEQIIAELDALIKHEPITYAELEDLANYVIASDAEAKHLLVTLRDGLRQELARRLAAEPKSGA
jgi:hypothetical protein